MYLKAATANYRIDLIFSLIIGTRKLVIASELLRPSFLFPLVSVVKTFFIAVFAKFCFTKSFVSEYDALRLYAVCMSGNELF